ncbi:primosomal protein N', partial [Acidobacteria bacterium AH-259-L09]|nr:primosomal protein N' [Acidobacteria bacterium AH-259-L09]
FFEEEIRFRRNFQYPPFTALANLILHGDRQSKIRHLADQVLSLLLHNRDNLSVKRRMRILGPAPAALEKLKGQYRLQILIKTTSRKELHQVLECTLNDLREKKVSLKGISIDIDPISLL